MKPSRKGRREGAKTGKGKPAKSADRKSPATLSPAKLSSAPSQKPTVIPRDLPAPICGAFAVVYREERIRRGFSIYAVAKRAGVMSRTIRLIERCKSRPTLDMAKRITAVMGVPLGWLITRAELES